LRPTASRNKRISSVRACPIAAVKCPRYNTFWMKICRKSTVKLLGTWKSAQVARALLEGHIKK